MGLLGGIANGVGTIASVGANILSKVTSLGTKAIGGVGKLLTSKLGIVALGSLGGILLVNNIDGKKDGAEIAKASDGKSGGFDGFMGAAKDTISGVIGGAASLFKGLAEKVTTAAKNLFGKKDKDNDLDKAVDDASRSNGIQGLISDVAESAKQYADGQKESQAQAETTEKDAGEEYGA